MSPIVWKLQIYFLFIDLIFEKINPIRTVTTTIGVFIVFWCKSERTLTRVRQNAIRFKSFKNDLLHSRYTTWIRRRSIGIPVSDAVRTDFIGVLQKMVLNSKSVLIDQFLQSYAQSDKSDSESFEIVEIWSEVWSEFISQKEANLSKNFHCPMSYKHSS